MKTDTIKRIPLGVLLIAAFYLFGALVLLVGIFFNPAGASQAIARAHGLSPVMGVEILLVVALLAFVLAYGLVRLRRWGFFLALAYSLYIAGVSLAMGGLSFAWTRQPELQVYFGNLLWSALVVVTLLLTRRRFFDRR